MKEQCCLCGKKRPSLDVDGDSMCQSCLNSHINSLNAERDMWRAVAEMACEKMQETPISIGHKELCPMDGSAKCRDCRTLVKVKNPTRCWLDRFKQLVQETTK